MKLEYARIDLLSIINAAHGEAKGLMQITNWLHSLGDVEYKYDQRCFFVLKGSPSHTLIALRYGDLFD